jgi:hypothetical protein
MKKFVMYFCILVVIFLSYACDKGSGSSELGQDSFSASYNLNGPNICGDYLEVNLIAGQFIDVGSVYVANDEDYLYVSFVTSDDCAELAETHVDVQTSADDFPLNKNDNPKVGHFMYKMEHGPGVTGYTYMIPLDSHGFEPGDEIFVAAHAVIQFCENDCGLVEETAWAGCTPFNDQGNWGRYIDSYIVQECI